MIPTAFEYERPASVVEALATLDQYGTDARILAGGQSLLPLLKTRALSPGVLVDIGALDDLCGIAADAGALTIGARATQAELLAASEFGGRFANLRADASLLGDPVIRNRGTLAGALAFADPASDWTALAIVLDAKVHVRRASSTRAIAIADFLRDAFETALQPTEIITHVTLTIPGRDAVLSYRKVRHPATGSALAGAAVLLDRDVDGNSTVQRVAITGAGRRAIRASGVERALEGRRLSHDAIEDAVCHATDELEVLNDSSASATHRERLARACVRRALSDGLAAPG